MVSGFSRGRQGGPAALGWQSPEWSGGSGFGVVGGDSAALKNLETPELSGGSGTRVAGSLL